MTILRHNPRSCWVGGGAKAVLCKHVELKEAELMQHRLKRCIEKEAKTR